MPGHGRLDEPIAGGRHKVFGHHDLAVIPTSTIARIPARSGWRSRSTGPQARRSVDWPERRRRLQLR
jgi:2-oxoisovalerate dehydrogenase E1 component